MSGSINIPGVNFQPEKYPQLLAEKSRKVAQMIEAFGAPKPDIFASPTLHARMRAEFRLWHPKPPSSGGAFYAMFEKNNKFDPIKIEQFPIASQCIAEVMQPLLDVINQSPPLLDKLFQIEFLSSSIDQLVITLIYHKPLNADWEAAARALENQFNASIIGRSRKQKIVLSKDYIIEKLTIDNIEYQYQQKENSFTQPNAAINQQMIQWVSNKVALRTPSKNDLDLLELYCGNGNFTIPLAKHFNKVLATEIAKSSIASAQLNCQFNHSDNIEFVRLSGEETASALNNERTFRRLKHIDLADYNFGYVFVDPPRVGIDLKTIRLIQRFDSIIYVSCNPESLADNLTTLTKTHKIEDFAIFDQFPYTPHCECAVILSRR